MAEPKRKMLPLAKIKANQQNPRIISESKLKKLINSLLVFPKMMILRPITLDDDDFVLGGNMRQTALGRIAQMTFEELSEHIKTLPEFNDMDENSQREVLTFWKRFLKRPMAYVQYGSEMTESEKRQFIIKDNVSFGDWDYDELENWDADKLEAWGIDTQLPDFSVAEQSGLDISDDFLKQNKELNANSFDNKIKMVLYLDIEENAFITSKVSGGNTKEQVILNALGYEGK